MTISDSDVENVLRLTNRVRGSIGDRTFSANASGPYVRQRVVPLNPDTPLQQQVRRGFRRIVRRWSGWLDDDARSRWNAYARAMVRTSPIKRTAHPSGRDEFLRLNLMRQAFGLLDHYYPPQAFNVAWQLPYVITMTAPSPLIAINWTGTQPFFGDPWARLFCSSTVRHPSTINSFKPPYIRRIALPGGGSPPLTFGSGQVVTAGDRVFVKIVTQWGDGRLTPSWRVRVIVQ